MDAVVQVEPNKGRERPVGHSAFDATQDTVSLLSYEHTVLAHVELFSHHNHQVSFCRAAFNDFSIQFLLFSGTALSEAPCTQEVHMSSNLNFVQVPLNDIPSFCCVNCQLRAIDYHSLSIAIQPIHYPLNDPPFKFISLQFRDQDVTWDYDKSLTEVQVADISWSSVVD